MKREIKISVITVCYNAETVIEKTIQSVVEQNYANIEYLIIDGKSEDSTMNIISQYAGVYNIKCLSEKDNGIYDAMNKGIRIATGEYIQFLNAGDRFADNYVIEKVVEQIEQNPTDILYGDIIYQYPDGNTNVRTYGQFCSSSLYYLLGDCINHQAIFARCECFEDNLFDLSYKICADRVWMLKAKQNGKKFRAINQVICYYSLDENSASIKNGQVYFEEAARCVREQLGTGYWFYCFIDRVRHGKISAKILHGLYKIVFIRK